MEIILHQLEFRRYELRFKQPLKMARGMITARNGLILKFKVDERLVYSELLPLPHFGSETLEQAVSFLDRLSAQDQFRYEDIPSSLPATRFAVESAVWEASVPSDSTSSTPRWMPVSLLLPSDKRIYDALEAGLEQGYSIYKMKIGLRDIQSEMEVINRVIARLPVTAKIRLDANEGLTLEQADRLLGNLEDQPVEFLEQPLQRHRVREMIELSEKYSTEVALDESAATAQEMIDCYSLGFNGVFSAKPMRLGELGKFIQWRRTTEAKISYSTAFETRIGSIFGLKLAASDPRNSYGLGYGTSQWIENDWLVIETRPGIELQTILSTDKKGVWDKLAAP